MKLKVSVVVLALALCLLGSWSLANFSQAEEGKKFDYVGAKTCKMCHGAKTGDQYKIWSEGPHAKAFEVLASEKALADAKEKGIEDPQKAEACLKCHVTAFAVMGDLENQKITMEEGVSCESCHGPGSEYKSKKVKDGIKAGEIEPASVGLWTVDEKLCVTCHQAEGNSFHKEFKFEEAVKKIAHPIPSE